MLKQPPRDRLTQIKLFFQDKAGLFFLLVILFFSAAVRLKNAFELHGVTYADGGRDILVAKHLVDGKTTWGIAPWSTIETIPNTPVYYWMLAGAYALGNLTAIAWLHVIAGIAVVALAFFISQTLFKNVWLSVSFGFLAAISSKLIEISIGVWPPYTQMAWIAASILLGIKTTLSHKENEYWWCMVPLWFSAVLHANALPLAVIMMVYLLVDYWRFPAKKQFSHEFWLYMVGWGFFWLSWVILSYVIGGVAELGDRKTLFENIIDRSPSPELWSEKITELFNHLFLLSSRIGFLADWLEITLSSLIVVALLKNIFISGPLPKRIATLFLALLSIFCLIIIVPGREFKDWYFYTQLFLVFILLGHLPVLLFGVRKKVFILQLFWFFWLVWLALPNFRYSLLPNRDGHRLNERIAEIIVKDREQYGVKINDFSLGVRYYPSNNQSLEVLTSQWLAGGIQLALEELNPTFQQRISVVPHTVYWANYREPEAATTYLGCVGYPIDRIDDCVADLRTDTGATVSATRLEIFQGIERGPIVLYKLDK